MKKTRVTESTALKVISRDKMKCQNPQCSSRYGHLHHCFQKSFYFGKDKNESWNLICVCNSCHEHIHHLGTKKGLFLDWLFKTKALKRYNGNRKLELELKIKRVKYKLDKK